MRAEEVDVGKSSAAIAMDAELDLPFTALAEPTRYVGAIGPKTPGLSLGTRPQFHDLRRSRNPRPSKIAGIAFSIRAVRVPDCFAPAK